MGIQRLGFVDASQFGLVTALSFWVFFPHDPVKENLDEEDLQNNGDELGVGGRVVISDVEPEVIVHDVVDLGRSQQKNLSQDGLDLLWLIDHVAVNVVTDANLL